jgi:hypothetical protein
MNPSTANPPVFDELDLSYPIQSPFVSQQTHELYGRHLALNGSASQMQPLDGQLTPGQTHIPHSSHPSPAFHIQAPHIEESFGDAQTMPAIPIGPPTRPRKRKATTLHSNAWEPYKARIIELHIQQGLPLRQVRENIIKEFGFTAEYVSIFKVKESRLLMC